MSNSIGYNHRDAGEYAESSRIAQQHDEGELAAHQDSIMTETYAIGDADDAAAAEAALRERLANDEFMAHLQDMT